MTKKQTPEEKKKEEDHKSTPVLSKYMADYFEGWYCKGSVKNEVFVVDPIILTRFSNARQRILTLTKNALPAWWDVWGIKSIVVGD